MKKFNVGKLLELKRKEMQKLKDLQHAQHNADRIIQMHEELIAIRTDLAVESEKLNEVIRDAEGRASVRRINAQDIILALIEVDHFLRVSKKNMKGTRVTIDCNAQKFPNAYKWIPSSTIFSAEFSSGWFVTDIRRDKPQTKKYRLTLSESAKAEYLKKAETLGE